MEREATATLKQLAKRLTGSAEDLDAVIDAAKDKRFVLIGEATHGTHEFHRTRADISER